MAIGLILTFLGLIFALSTAAKGMQGGDVGVAQAALKGLLVVAGAKFFTSVGGLAASLALRFAEHGLTRAVVRRTEDMCSLLERGLLYVPPQKLAVEQLEELREQSRELKTFNADLALQIGERVGVQFHQALAPVAASLASLPADLASQVGERMGPKLDEAIAPVTDALSALNGGIASMSEGLREGLGQGAAEAVSAAASGELRALGDTLNLLRQQLESLGGHVGASGEDAARQIRLAGSDFREAADAIRAAFAQLAGQVDGLGARMVEQGETAARLQADTLERAFGQLETAQERSTQAMHERFESLSGHIGTSGEEASHQIRVAAGVFQTAAEGMRTAFDQLAGQVDGLGARMMEQGEATQRSQAEAMTRALERLESAQARSAEALGSAVNALQGAGRAAASGLQDGLSSALTMGVRESEATFRHAVEESQTRFRDAVTESGEGLRSASAGLARAVDEASGRVIEAAGLFQRGGEGARIAAEAMGGVADRARQAAVSLGDAASDISSAASPVAQSAQAVTAAADRLTRAQEAGRDAEADALAQVRALADGMRETAASAETAWRDYRARFEGVDRSLGEVTVKLSETLGDSIGQFRDFAQKVDSNLADAVGRLGASLTAIEDYAETLDAYIDSLDAPALEAAE